jgi:uncharacterized membrane protein
VTATDSDLELLIGRVLRTGVAISSACLIVGLILQLRSPEDGVWLLNTGILLLIVTPAARVVLSLVEFVVNRDGPFAGLTAIVLAELLSGAIAAFVFRKSL